MKKLFLIGLVLLFSVSTLNGEKVILKDGKSFEDKIKSFEDSLLILEQGDKVYRSNLKEIKFSAPILEEVEKFSDTIPVKQILDISSQATERFKDARGIILLDDGTDILHPDGTRTYRYHFIGKILKPETKEWATKRFRFDENRQKVHILLARTIHPDGKISWLDRSKIKLTTPSQEMVFFGKHKALSFDIPEVSVNDIVEYVYEYDVFKPWDTNIFSPAFFFQSKEPVVQSKFTVVIPDTKELNFYARNFPSEISEPEISELDGQKIYKWELENVPGIIPEPLMPADIDIAPGIFASLFTDWEYLFDWDAKFELRRMEVTPEIEELTNRIVKGATTIDDSIAQIYHWVERNIRYISIKGSISSGIAGHPAAVTLSNGFGDCIDKSILFSTMLKVIGVDAYPVGLTTNDEGHPPREIPISWTGHAITEVHLKDRIFWLDPTGEMYRYPYFWDADHGVTCINSITHKINYIPVPPPEHNARLYEIDMTLEPSLDAIVKFDSKYTGNWEAGIRGFWKYTRESERPQRIRQIINEESPGAELIDYEIGPVDDLSKQFFLHWEYKLKDYPIKAGDMLIFKIPELRSYECGEVSLKTRKYDLEYPTSCEVRQHARVSIPEGYKVEWLPEPISLACEQGSYKAEYKELPGSVIEFTDKFQRKATIIKVKDYNEYKQFLTEVANYAKTQIFLKIK
ncbi:DUF3857 domain-containing transglutaminase family protein [candidate division WOR-3 bacterium]|nr:DUF3857 domain-containing transglutaminase family protein [candidate division WOR-3 bacterium]